MTEDTGPIPPTSENEVPSTGESSVPPPRVACRDCRCPASIAIDVCPHCGRPALFPNVRLAEQPTEQQALQRRYEQAADAADVGGYREIFDDFVDAAANSQAVIARDYVEILQISRGDNKLLKTFHQLIEAPVEFPAGSEWDVWRDAAGDLLFGIDYKRQVHYAALSLDGIGLLNYGDAFMILAECKIAHRASAFEENSAEFIRARGNDAMEDFPKGYRSTWEQRATLCAAKLSEHLQNVQDRSEFAQLLLRQGVPTKDDRFVEIHVGGPITVRTLKKVILTGDAEDYFEVLRQRLDRFGVEVECIATNDIERALTPESTRN